MAPDALKEVLLARPFRPFLMHMADGRHLNVPHPELMAILGSGRTVVVGYPESDRFEVIDIVHIGSIEVGANLNGTKRKSA